MGNIITVSRQFGSGGREVAKRLADILSYPYYDKEIIAAVADKTGFSDEFVEKYSDGNFTRSYPYTFGRAFGGYVQSPSETVYVEQIKVIANLPQNDGFIIVGRGADYVLKDKQPIKLFIYSSDMDFRIERCYSKVPSDNSKSRKEMEKEIMRVDKQRAKCYEYYTNQKWADMSNYNLCVDTSKFGIDGAVDMLARLLK